MSTLDASMVRPLVTSEELREARLLVSFACPVTGATVQSWATVGAAPPAPAPTTLLGRARSRLSQLVSGLIPARSGAEGGSPAGEADEAARDRALVDAFRRVAAHFRWDRTDQRFVSADLMDDLQTELWHLLRASRFTEPADQRILARMLAEVAAVDGRIADDERAFFEAFAGSSAGTLDELLVRARLTEDDLTDSSPGLREQMLALAYALAYTDTDFADAEGRLLAAYSSALGIPDGRRRDLERMARDYVVDQVLESVYEDRTMDAEEQARVSALAARVGVTPEGLAVLDERCRRRKGIAAGEA